MTIDLDRGVTKRLTSAGVSVYMYKDEPGVFRSAFGSEVSADIAREAGFEVDKLLKERDKRARLSEAMTAIEQEYNEYAEGGKEIVEREGWKLIAIGNGMHNIMDPDGNKVNPMPMAAEAAGKLFEHMVPQGGVEMTTIDADVEDVKEKVEVPAQHIPELSDKQKLAAKVVGGAKEDDHGKASA